MDLFTNRKILADLCAALRAELRHYTISGLKSALRASCRSCRSGLRLSTVTTELSSITCLTASACPTSCRSCRSGLRLSAIAAELACIARLSASACPTSGSCLLYRSCLLNCSAEEAALLNATLLLNCIKSCSSSIVAAYGTHHTETHEAVNCAVSVSTGSLHSLCLTESNSCTESTGILTIELCFVDLLDSLT